MAVEWPKTVKTHNLPRLIWAAKNSRGANFFHLSNFARYTYFMASQLNNNGRWVAKNSQNTQFATFNLGRKKFARRELSSSQPFCTLHVFYSIPTKKMAVVWPKTVKTHNLPRLIWAAKNSRCANFFHLSHFASYTYFTASQLKKTAVEWPKTVKTHNLPRLIWAARSSRGANFFHPSYFARYTSFTTSQLNKNGRCVAKNSQNTQFATFDLGRKKFARRELFSSQPFCTLNVFYGVPTE